MLTSSQQERDVVESYDLGVNSYIVKPVDFSKFADSISRRPLLAALKPNRALTRVSPISDRRLQLALCAAGHSARAPGRPKTRHPLALLSPKSKPQGNNRMTVVFDSREGAGNRTQKGAIEVVYTAGETADDWIIQAVRKAPNPARRGRRHQRSSHTAADPGNRRQMDSVAGISQANAVAPRAAAALKDAPGLEEITEEFKKKWLY